MAASNVRTDVQSIEDSEFENLIRTIYYIEEFIYYTHRVDEQWTSRCASVFSLVGIAIDRYRAIVTPLEPKLTRSHAAGIISVVWIASLGYSARKPALLDVVPFTWYNVTILACYVPYGWKAELSRLFHLVDFLVMYLIPLIIMTGLYIAMIVSLRKKGPTNLSNRNKRKAIKMLMLVVLSFALSWLPHYILLLYWNFTDYEDIPMGMKKGAWVMRHIEAFSYNSNSWTNPCLYAYFNENFRKEFYRMFPCLEKCLKGNKIVPKTSKSSQEPNTLQTRATVQEPNAINLNQK
uniref:Neuropeptide FF receptor 2-like n=1 Tax=Saccoglossus kowalevskii TaxID=10224 RepID=A0ABM0MAY6_SACKO|nr:PREDICTED: neuropeptide FF receptor 2-like [Saccoglossus kowalevskii]